MSFIVATTLAARGGMQRQQPFLGARDAQQNEKQMRRVCARRASALTTQPARNQKTNSTNDPNNGLGAPKKERRVLPDKISRVFFVRRFVFLLSRAKTKLLPPPSNSLAQSRR